MKYWKQQSPKRLSALYLALNWFLTDLENIRELSNPDAEWLKEDSVSYSGEEVEECCARRYVDRYRTKRLRKKHADVLAALVRGNLRARGHLHVSKAETRLVSLGFLVALLAPLLQGQISGPACERESISPNLTLFERTAISGIVVDSSGAPYTEGYKVDVRDGKSGIVLRSTSLDSSGRLSVPSIPKGTFRLVVYGQRGAVVSRVPLMDQPEKLVCHASSVCRLTIVLKSHGTDQPFEFCPPR